MTSFIFIADCVYFSLQYLLKLFTGDNLTTDKKIFNKKLLSARQVIK